MTGKPCSVITPRRRLTERTDNCEVRISNVVLAPFVLTLALILGRLV